MVDSPSISDELAAKTFKELGFDPKTGKFSNSPNPSYPSPHSSYHMIQPKTPFRMRGLERTAYQSATGTTYRYSTLYRNAVVFQLLIEKWLSGLDRRRHHRLITQDTDACRSMVANIAEGYARPTAKPVLRKLPPTLFMLKTPNFFLPVRAQLLPQSG